MEKTYKELVHSAVKMTVELWNRRPLVYGAMDLYDIVAAALAKWNLTIDDVLNDAADDDVNYEKAYLQMIFDVSKNAYIEKAGMDYEEYHTLSGKARIWVDRLPEKHPVSKNHICLNGSCGEEYYKDYIEQFGLI